MDAFETAARAEAERAWFEGPPTLDTIADLGAHMAEWARTHLAAQEPTDAGPHELVEGAPILNLGYYRSATRCLCGYEVIWGEHDGDAGLDEAWRVHLMRSNVSAARTARRDEEKR